MYVLRETFTAKPGMASKLAAHLKSVITMLPRAKTRVLTDYVGSFNTVVMETEMSDLGDFDREMKEYTARQDVQDAMRGYTDMYQSGRREIYRVV